MRGQRGVREEIRLLQFVGRRLRGAGVEAAGVGVVLGSGLKDFAAELEDSVRVDLADIPELPRPRVEGHGGGLVQGRIGKTRVHCLQGRVHLYEGYHPWEVVRAVRSLALLGTRTFVLTNAAGGIRDGLGPGALMLLTDHLNLSGRNVLEGEHDPLLGPRFPSLVDVYSPACRRALHVHDPNLEEGVYAQLGGPSYETPAEIRMVRTLGGDAVGMSTVPEAIALAAMGCRVAGISLITNRAAGLSQAPPRHDEVLEVAARTAARLRALLVRAIPDLRAPPADPGGPAPARGAPRRDPA